MSAQDGLGPATRTLLHRLKAGEESDAGWNALLDRVERNYLQPLEAYLARAGLTPPDRDDLLSEIRLSLARGRLKSYDPDRGNFRAWLFHAITREHLSRWFRKRAADRMVPLPEQIATRASLPGGEVEGAWEATCIAQAVLDAVVVTFETYISGSSRRAERVRDILTLVWVEGKDPAAAGREVGILGPAVRYHLRRARRKLLAVLIDQLTERDLAGGPFEGYCRQLRERGKNGSVDSLVRGAARYLVDQESSQVGTTMAIRRRLSPS